MIIRALLAGTALLAAMSCLVDRKSDSLACTTSTDCASGRTCESGYCVEQTSSGCPAHCATCDATTTPKTCIVTDTGGDTFTCPTGFECIVTCGAGGCGDLFCATGSQCRITCNGAGACGTITCTNACACDVTCPNGSCDTIHCPHQGNNYCTPDQSDGPACTSAAGGRCNSC